MFHDLADMADFNLARGFLGLTININRSLKISLNLQAGRLHRQAEDAHIERTVFQFFDDLISEIAIDADLHIGKTAAIFGENFGQNIKAGGFVGPDKQRSARRMPVIGDRDQGFVAQLFHAQGIVVEDLAGGSQLHGLARAIEQAVAILLLQLANLGADRRLRTENFFSGAREAALPGDLEECNELIEIHVGL